MSMFRNLLMKVFGWTGKPSDWSDIRKDCPANSIALYAAHSEDFSSYDNLGFTATCTGGYNVYIDGTQYGTTYASGATCSITWSTSGITTGDDITTPSALKAHKIWIEPATEGNNITTFNCDRVGSSGYEAQGVLWGHFNLQNDIRIRYLFSRASYYKNILFALTAKNNKISFTGSLTEFVDNQPNLEYLPTLISKDGVIDMPGAFSSCSKNKVITLENATIASAYNAFNNNLLLEEIKCKNTKVVVAHSSLNSMYNDCRKLKAFIPTTFTSSLQRMSKYAVNCQSLEDTIIDTRDATNLKNIDAYSQNATYFAAGIKGLRVSNQAPFDYGTAPQINVSYTGMDRQALVTLFNDLPTVSSGQVINITGTTGAMNLTDDDLAIAVNKGWTVVGGPAYTTVPYYAYTEYTLPQVMENNGCTESSPFVYKGGGGDTNLNYKATNFINLNYGWRIRVKYKKDSGSYSSYPTIIGSNALDAVIASFPFICINNWNNKLNLAISYDGVVGHYIIGDDINYQLSSNYNYIELGCIKQTNNYLYYAKANTTGFDDSTTYIWSTTSEHAAYYNGGGLAFLNTINTTGRNNIGSIDFNETYIDYKPSENAEFSRISFKEVASNPTYNNATVYGRSSIISNKYVISDKIINNGCTEVSNLVYIANTNGNVNQNLNYNVTNFINLNYGWRIRIKYLRNGYTTGSSYPTIVGSNALDATIASFPMISLNQSSGKFNLAISYDGVPGHFIIGDDINSSPSGSSTYNYIELGCIKQTNDYLYYFKKNITAFNDNYNLSDFVWYTTSEHTAYYNGEGLEFLNSPGSYRANYGTIDFNDTYIDYKASENAEFTRISFKEARELYEETGNNQFQLLNPQPDYSVQSDFININSDWYQRNSNNDKNKVEIQ